MINKDDVRYIAGLARIHVPEDELQGFTKNLEDIISYVDQLNELNVENVEPTSHVLNLKNVYRLDEVKPSLPQEDALKFAVESYQGSFKVPRVIE
jgi:aspartyl-tRNA(Asn)/glutamyl-tRNA(Gln) amidotransferase subunit C